MMALNLLRASQIERQDGSRREVGRHNGEQHLCARCGRAFTFNHRGQKAYCSSACGDKAWAKKSNTRRQADPAYRMAQASRNKAWRERNRDYQTQRVKAWVKENPVAACDYRRRSHLKYEYGISDDQYAAILKAQGGHCACCEAVTGARGRRLSVDHCHAEAERTGATTVRGLLCDRCNMVLGLVKDSTLVLGRLGAYLELAGGVGILSPNGAAGSLCSEARAGTEVAPVGAIAPFEVDRG